MPNPFPIQFLSLLAYTILRIFIGFVLVRLGLKTARSAEHVPTPFRAAALNRKNVIVAIGCIETLLGFLYITGFMTQYTALVTIALAISMLMFGNRSVTAPWPERLSWKFMLITSISLFITGAGIFAFDLPV